MAVIDKIISLLSGGLVKQTGEIIDKFVTTDAEREKAKNELATLFLTAEQQAQDELTERQRIDMNSDSWLSKNIRPLLMIFFAGMFTFFAFTDGNVLGFVVKETYQKAFAGFMDTGIMFYYGSRGVEKIIESVGRYQIKRRNK